MPTICAAARGEHERCLKSGRSSWTALLEIRPPRFGDERGFFSEVWSEDALARGRASTCDFVQDNHSLFGAEGVLRGLHFQLPPAAQDKLVRVSRGAIFDVAVDIRRGSPTFGQWVGRRPFGRGMEPAVRARRASRTASDARGRYRGAATRSARPIAPRTTARSASTIRRSASIGRDAGAHSMLSDKDRAAPRLPTLEAGFA